MRTNSLTVGVTGTKEGMTAYQRELVRWHFQMFTHYYSQLEIQHGDCVGSDEQFVEIARREWALARIADALRVEARPMKDSPHRANIPSDFMHTPQPPLTRNRFIVESSQILIATPKERDEIMRSGTWTTCRYAWAFPIPVIVIPPAGSIFSINRA